MTTNREQLIDHYNTSRTSLLSAIDGLTPEHLTERPPDGWSIKDQLFHIAAWDNIRATEVTRISAGHDTAWRMTGEQDERQNGIFFDQHKDLGIDQAMWES